MRGPGGGQSFPLPHTGEGVPMPGAHGVARGTVSASVRSGTMRLSRIVMRGPAEGASTRFGPIRVPPPLALAHGVGCRIAPYRTSAGPLGDLAACRVARMVCGTASVRSGPSRRSRFDGSGTGRPAAPRPKVAQRAAAGHSHSAPAASSSPSRAPRHTYRTTWPASS